MKQILKILTVACILMSMLNANENRHNIHVGLDTLNGDINADYGINLGYSYILGDNWKYGVGTNIIIANGDDKIGDTFSADIRVGKEIYKYTTLYAFLGASAMNTSYKNGSDDEIASGITYGILCNYELTNYFDVQFGYKAYNLKYDKNNITKKHDINSLTINFIYKF